MELQRVIKSSDELIGYVNKFLPHKFTTNHGTKNQNEDDSDNEDQASVDETPNQSDVTHEVSEKTSRAKTIEELHKRIETLKGKKANYKEKLLKKGLKNRLKKKEKLEKRSLLKKQNKNNKREKMEVDQEAKPEVLANDSIKTEEQEQKIDFKFNKVVFSESESNKTKEGDVKSLLIKIEKKNKKLKELELKGKKEKVTEIKSKEVWEAAIKKAEGVKIKDNVELLKKSVAKIKNRKNQSKKKWDDREKNVKTKKEELQKKRQDNIDKKKKERSKKRTKVLIKKGRILPK